MVIKDAAAVLSALPEPLLNWYDTKARALPWRELPTPYRVWVSEIMLQQTRVEAVKPYFERFISALPDIEALAGADVDLLLKLWEGLGYYSRVRNLQKAARVVMNQYGGQLPASFEALRSLPGIGPYTAGAVASIAYGIPVAAVDGNVLRVTARVLASREDIKKAEVKKAVEQMLTAILPVRPGDFNQAMMELGALVCLPGGAAHCEVCPVNGICQAFQQGVVRELPVKTVKKPRKIEDRTVFIPLCQAKTALHKRAETGLLAGMWELPNVQGRLDEPQVTALLAQWDVKVLHMEELPPAKHIFSHIEWHMNGYMVTVDRCAAGDSWMWADKQSLREQIALPSAFKAYVKELKKFL